MKDRKHVAWLYGQVPTLVAEGVLPAEAAEKIRRRYGELPAGGGRQWAILIFGVLGAALIGAGAILLVAHNWDDLSRDVRTALAFAPLVMAIALGGWVLARRRASAPWCEGVATYWVLTIGATISLVAQIYQIHGDTARFFLTWILLGLPIVYLLQSSVAACLYFIGATTWAGCAAHWYAPGTALWYWGLLALALPYLARMWCGDREPWRAGLTGWILAICLCIGTAFSLEGMMNGAWIGAYTGLLALMYLAGARRFGDASTAWQRPWQSVGALGLGVVALLLTYDWPWKEIHYHHWREAWTSGSALIMGNTLAALLPIAAICAAAREAREAQWGKLDSLMVGLAPICGVIGYVLAATRELHALPQALFNVYLFALGLSALVTGIRGNKLGRVNAGLLALSALLIARFFDSDLSFLARGVAFILVGAGFLATNVVMLRRKGAAAP
jgi:uncharacterized membrane protein